MRGSLGLVLVGALGCFPSAMGGETETETDDGTSEGVTSVTPLTTSSTTGEADTGDTTAAATDECGADGCTAGSSTGEEIVLPCTLATLAPGVRSPVVTGEGEGVLPPEIGTVLESYCGCHLVEDNALLVDKTPVYNGSIRFRTWEEFHQPFKAGQTYEEVEARTIVQISMPPVYHCDTFDFGSLLADDYELFGAWLAADAPDAASWNP